MLKYICPNRKRKVVEHIVQVGIVYNENYNENINENYGFCKIRTFVPESKDLYKSMRMVHLPEEKKTGV